MIMEKKVISLTFNEVEQGADRVEDERLKPKKDLEFSVIKVFGRLSEKKNSPVLALINWNGHERYDLRKWNDEMTVPYKGITFSDSEIEELLSLNTENKSQSECRFQYSGGKATARIYDKLAELSFETVRDETWTKEVNVVDWGYGKK